MGDQFIEIGNKYGHLEVVALNRSEKRGKSWVCRCVCGNEIILTSAHLLGTKNRRPNKSCGCAENAYGGKAVKYPRVYSIWKGMIDRCYVEERENYERYGGKGIKVCDEWLNDFESFLEWSLKNGYNEDLNINRIDITKNYEPSNCRWANIFVVAQNKGIMKNNKTGVTGVSYFEEHQHYRAYITRDRIRKNLGSFQTLELAKEARLKAEEHYKKYGTIKDL